MGRVLAVVSHKGGVGKTTTAINLAAALAQRGVRTLLIDADPQGSVRYGLGLHGASDRLGLSDYLAGQVSMRDVVRPTMLPWLRVVGAGSVTEAGNHEEYALDFGTSPGVRELFARARDNDYTVVVDTPPGLGIIVHAVLAEVQHVLVPLQAEPLALQTTAQILNGLRAALERNPALSLEGILLTMVERDNPVSARVAGYVRSQMPPGVVLDIEIPRTQASSEAFAASQPLVVRSPADPGAQAYAALAERMAEKLK